MTSKKIQCLLPQSLLGGALLTFAATANAGDWPMLGRDSTRNPVSPETNAPLEWDVKTGRNIKWKAELGGIAVAEPIVAGGLVWIGTNNDSPRDPKITGRGGVLACFRESNGEFLYQHVSVVTGRRTPDFGITGSPMAEGARLWFVNSASEVLCLDTSLLRSSKKPPETVWRLEMLDELGIYPAVDIMGGKGICSIGAYRDWIYVITGNGHEWTRNNVPFPSAPALVCLDKRTGRIVWEDNSPGSKIIFGEFASPLVMEIGGVPQIIAPQGDGWVRSFEAATGKLLWKFDINPHSTARKHDRNFFLNAPVFHEGRIYIAGGQDRESGEGPGRLVCLDPTKRGDLSLELADGPGRGKPNPNSGAFWHFDGIGRTLSSPAVHNGFVLAADLGGILYCLDVATGRRLWAHDTGAHIWGSPLVVDDKIYIGNEDGYVLVFRLARDKQLLFKAEFDAPVYSSPIFANGVLYLVAQPTIHAIQSGVGPATQQLPHSNPR